MPPDRNMLSANMWIETGFLFCSMLTGRIPATVAGKKRLGSPWTGGLPVV